MFKSVLLVFISMLLVRSSYSYERSVFNSPVLSDFLEIVDEVGANGASMMAAIPSEDYMEGDFSCSEKVSSIKTMERLNQVFDTIIGTESDFLGYSVNREKVTSEFLRVLGGEEYWVCESMEFGNRAIVEKYQIRSLNYRFGIEIAYED